MAITFTAIPRGLLPRVRMSRQTELAHRLLIAFWVALQHFDELWREARMSGAGSIATNQSQARA